MNRINLNVTGNKLTLSDGGNPGTGSCNYDRCFFTFDNEWRLYEKKAVFTIGDTECAEFIVDDKCFIPPECLREPGLLKIGVAGLNNSGIIISTNCVSLRVKRGANENGAYPAVFVSTVNQFSEGGGAG